MLGDGGVTNVKRQMGVRCSQSMYTWMLTTRQLHNFRGLAGSTCCRQPFLVSNVV